MNSDLNGIPGFDANTGWCSGPQLEDATNITVNRSQQTALFDFQTTTAPAGRGNLHAEQPVTKTKRGWKKG